MHQRHAERRLFAGVKHGFIAIFLNHAASHMFVAGEGIFATRLLQLPPEAGLEKGGYLSRFS